jgi:hypothetical protein
MSNIILGSGPSGSGSLTLQAPNTNSNQIVSLPDRTGNMMMDGPAFYATAGVNQTINTNTTTTVQFTSKDFDTASCFNTSTYRFTPNVPGYYFFTFNALASGTWGTGEVFGFVVKNSTGYLMFDTSGASFWTIQGSVLLYANGTTDYFTCQIAQYSGSSKTTSTGMSFCGYMARGA